MSALIIDTSIWIDYFSKGEFSEIEGFLKDGRVYTTPIVVAELLSGSLKAKEIAKLTEFLKDLPITPSDFEHWARVGLLRSRLRAKGLSVSTPDAHIAQSCIDLNSYLLTRDKIFASIAKHSALRLAPQLV